MILQIKDSSEKETIAHEILSNLTEWFGLPDAKEQYCHDAADQIMLAAAIDGAAVGFLTLKETGPETVEIAVMGVKRKYHRQGIGRALVRAALETAAADGYRFMQVKTVAMGRYTQYDQTNLFYQSMQFTPFEVFPTLWSEANPCQIYIRNIP